MNPVFDLHNLGLLGVSIFGFVSGFRVCWASGGRVGFFPKASRAV